MEQMDFKADNPTRKKMISEPVWKLIIQMAIPTTLIQIISVIYNTADTYFVAHIGKSAAAAVGVGFSLMSIIQAVGLGLGMGAGSLISRELGAGEEKKACVNGNSALTAAVGTAIIFSCIGLINIESLMRLLGASDSMLTYACDYARFIFVGCPIMCATLVMNIILRSEGHAKYAMFGVMTGGGLNIILDPFFIYYLGFGIAGAAIATSISQAVSCAILLIPFLSGKTIVKLRPLYISREFRTYRRIVVTGAPTICRQSLASFAAALLNREARTYGDAAVAAVTIANKVYLLIRHVILGIGQGFQPVAGYNFGAGNRARTKEAFKAACVLGTILCIIASAVIYFNAKEVIMWFQDDDEVVVMGMAALRFACLAMPFMAYATYVDQMYQCLGFSKTSTFLASFRQGILFVPIILSLPRIIGLTGVQLAQPMSDIFSFFFCIPFQILFFRRELSMN